MSVEKVSALLTSGSLRTEQAGRHFVLLSLAEAETIRCIMHLRQSKRILEGTDAALALRCIPAHDAVFDCTPNHPASPAYQRAVAHHCVRFIDGAMQFKPAELNILLRSIPEVPERRRLFFTHMIACRRRAKKEWKETPLAKLFTLEDEWAMLKERAHAVRLREAIKAKGWRLYDAFNKFDANDDGSLSFAEVWGALDYLHIQATPADVVEFVSAISAEGRIHYEQFYELLYPKVESTEDEMLQEAEDASALVPPMPRREASGQVVPRGEAELAAQYEALLSERQRSVAQVEEAERKLYEANKQRLTDNLMQAEFSWIQQSRDDGWANPKRLASCIFYDFTRGRAETQEGLPLRMEVRHLGSGSAGKWRFTKAGKGDLCSVPCASLSGGCYLILQPPVRRNGGEQARSINLHTITMQIRCTSGPRWESYLEERSESLLPRGFVATGGWDQLSPKAKSPSGKESTGEVVLGDDGYSCPGVDGDNEDEGSSEPKMLIDQWHTFTCAVDTIAGEIHTYVDGEHTGAFKGKELAKDGPFALQSRLACFYSSQYVDDDDGEMLDVLDGAVVTQVRSITVHGRVLDAEEVKKEHTTLLSLLIRDAIAAAPPLLRAVLREAHTSKPFVTPVAVLKSVMAHVAAVEERIAPLLWTVLYERDFERLEETLATLQPHELGLCALWRRRDPKSGELVHIDEAAPPFGETLLHQACFIGHQGTVQALLGAGARASRVGGASGCSALHAAAAADRADLCTALISAGASVHASSSGKRHMPLHIACIKGHDAVARALVEAGADPYDRGEAAASPIELLRAHETEQAKVLLKALEALSLETSLGAADADAAAAGETALSPPLPVKICSAATQSSELESVREEEEEFLNPREKPEVADKRLQKKRMARDAALEEQEQMDRLFEKVARRRTGERDEDEEGDEDDEDDEDDERFESSNGEEDKEEEDDDEEY